MQIKRLAALSLAAVLTAGMLTGCPWDIEDDASSVTSSPSSSSSTSRPSYDDEDDDDDTGNTGDTGGEDTETPDDPNKPSVTLENNKLIVTGGNGALTTEALKNLLPEGANKATIATLDLSKSGYTSIGNLADGLPLFIEQGNLEWSNLQSVILPAGLKSIGNAAFQGCSNLKSINLPDGLQSIGGNAFYSCPGLTSIDLPDGLTSIGKWALRSCTSLESVILPESLESIGVQAFAYCSSLKSIDLPDSLTSLGAIAFNKCTSLTSIRVGTGIMNPNATIANRAFEGVPANVTVYYPSELETNLEALKEKLKNAGLDTENYEPEAKMLQAAPAAPAGVKELLDVAGLFGL